MSRAAVQENRLRQDHVNSGESTDGVTLYVDLDGALCVTDTLWESLLALLRRRPWSLLRAPLWVLRGKAAFKREVADRALPEVETLPLRSEVLAVIEQHKAAGGQVVLATAADIRIAQAVAQRTGLFDDVLGTDGDTNLSAENKLEAVRRHAGGRPFDYIGDSRADVCLLRQCRRGYVAGRRGGVARAAQSGRAEGLPQIQRLQPSVGGPLAVLKALRPHQWAKNILVGVPLVVSHQLAAWPSIWQTVLAFCAFSLTASSVYIVNDLLDLPADRAHPRKRNRPFASGALSVPAGLILAATILTAAMFIAFAGLNPWFGTLLVIYLGASTAYSALLKRKLVMDVMVLAGLYTMRILAGAAAIEVQPTQWLLAFSIFVFTTLAMVKRYAELKAWSEINRTHMAGRFYTVADMELFRSVGPAAAYAAVLVFALYINSSDVVVLYDHPEVLWLVCPVMLYWLTRLWFLTNVPYGRRALEDPVLFALTDRASLVCGAVTALLVFIAT